MKRLCKDIDIADIGLISRAVYKCLECKYKRNDTIKYFSQVSGVSEDALKNILEDYGKEALYPVVDKICDILREEIISDNISFPKIWYREKIDGSSGKIRRIGIQNVKQQLYDYIAVEGLNPLLKRIGEYQCASIKGRGTLSGKKSIARWLKNKNNRYFAKLDVQKCFESIDQEKLLSFLQRHIKNDRLINLIRILIGSFEKGLSIGSYLSQYLCNLYMSILYHYIMEDLYRVRRGKEGNARVRLVNKCLIYMDDILIIGSRRRDLQKAIRLIIQKASELGLVIKSNYQIRSIDGNAIDMMGYKIYRTHTEIRGRIFLRIRRAYRKAISGISPRIAKKCLSYYGYLKHTDSRRTERKWKVKKIIRKCKEVMRNESKIYKPAAAGQYCYA
ncbi:MAG TPA: hypothetical protein IAB44_06225 [Candidatus Limivivens intestinipullorum]|uniref:Reverse transcriptase domain-containing protein n=1 Tax=Candidatus Limivivens intestinipullorum TaxID=2840858 RepID=A0A9D1JJM2_9FIRM|nr:hypothetical protein [Candidatus Limivivens intestinipullorum]